MTDAKRTPRLEDAQVIAMHSGRREMARDIANAAGAKADAVATEHSVAQGRVQAMTECLDLLRIAHANYAKSEDHDAGQRDLLETAIHLQIDDLEGKLAAEKNKCVLLRGMRDAYQQAFKDAERMHTEETERVRQVVAASIAARDTPPPAPERPKARKPGKHPGESLSGSRRRSVLKKQNGANT